MMHIKYYMRDLVWGANDGVITTFAVVAGVVGAELESRVILIMGAANLLGDGISMAASDFLASRSQMAVDAQDGVLERNGGAGRVNPVLCAFFTFTAFVLVGAVPLLPYLVLDREVGRFYIATALTGVALFVSGMLRTLVIRRNRMLAGLEMLGVGSIAAIAAYLVGRLLASISG
jgi:VIT1/CCC1 family predicted Fe2+/Mn2+ transporter